MKPYWEHFAHGADVGIRGVGRSLAEAFEQAGIALCAVITDPGDVAATSYLHVDIEPAEPDLMFIDWINRLVYETAITGKLFSQFDVTIDESGLHADVGGEPVDRKRHQPAVEVKGATFTELKVVNLDNGWLVQCIVDV